MHLFVELKKKKKHHQVVEEYKERHFDLMLNDGEEFGSHRVYTKPNSIDLVDNFH